MTTTLDQKQRAVIKAFQPGDVIKIEPHGADIVILKRMKPAQFPRPKLVRIKGELFGKWGKRVTTEQVKQLLEDES